MDLVLGAWLAGEVKPEFQGQTVGIVSALEIPEWLKAKLLGTTRSKAAIPGLLHALKHQDSDVRSSAASALGELDSEAGIPELLHALEDENSDVCLSAAEVLDKLAALEQPIFRLIKAIEVDEDNFNGRSAAEASGTLGFDQALDDEGSDVRRSAVEALGRSGSPEVIPQLLHALTDKDSDVRWSAVEALGKIDSPEAIPGLLHALTDKDYCVRRSAVEALGKIGSPEAIPGLLQTLEHEDSDVRESAVEALGKIGSPEAIPGLLHALTDKDSDVRWSAFEALGQIKQDNAPQSLPDLLALIPKSREEVLWAISDIQQNCQFYNYEIFRKPLPPVVSSQPLGATVTYTIDSEVVQIIEQNHGTVIGTQNLKATQD
ncbi:MAG TPA: HEAT repeat domain-containing protein [Waterburya sp.]